MKKKDTEEIRAVNRADIIKSLRIYGPVARVDIAHINKLSPATVTSITTELADEHVIREVSSPKESKGRGRPRVLIDLVPEHACVLGIKLSVNELRLMLGDLKGNIQAESVASIKTQTLDSDALNAELIHEASTFLDQHPTWKERLVSLGVALQGFVDVHRGNAVWSPALALRNVNLTRALEENFQCPVELANDAYCIGYAIREQPSYSDYRNFVVLMIGYGVGGSLVVNGELHSGHFGAASEFGHTKYSPTGPLCACGKRGCIESYVSDYALYRDATAIMDLPATDRRHPSEKQMQKLTQIARDGDPRALELFQHAGHVLGYGIANIIALMSPEEVIVTGPGIRAFDFMKADIEASIDGALVSELAGQTKISSYPWSEDMTGKGIIALALKHFE